MAATEKVSFTIRRPTPISRAASSGADSDGGTSFKVPSLPKHLMNLNDSAPGSPLGRSATSSPKPRSQAIYYNHEPDSSDEDEDEKIQDELVTGFDKFGVQRVNQDKKKREGPMVIPALQNRDWRAQARKRKSAAQYIPASAKAETGKDGSVGGLGVRDTINSGPVLTGLQLKKPRIKKEEDLISEVVVQEEDVKMEEVKIEEDQETEDQIALRAILAETDGVKHEGPVIDIIPTPISETDAYKQDVEELPEAATLEDYARVPVSQFGAALLRGMGWKEGTAASRKPGKGLVEPYIPEARPALLGIGAKEREVLDDGSKKKGNKRPEKRYVPVIKKEREEKTHSTPDGRDRSRSPRSRNGSSGITSRRSSRSPGHRRDYDDKRKDRGDDRRRDRDDDRWGGKSSDTRREERRERDYGRDSRDRDGDRSRGDTDRDRRRERSRESNRRR